uniref:Uncharacterized protein n=1 Tax=Anguilla anguilla TaxID=7936 RepID=A0A0E9R6V4_ANGAN
MAVQIFLFMCVDCSQVDRTGPGKTFTRLHIAGVKLQSWRAVVSAGFQCVLGASGSFIYIYFLNWKKSN